MPARYLPAGRVCTASEIVSGVVFFASDEAAFTIGGESLIDRGMSELWR